MIYYQSVLPTSTESLLASLPGTVQRLEQSEHPADFALMRHLLLERIAELETEAEQAPPESS